MEKLVMITGASSGIGKATAERLAGTGAELVVVARRREILEREAAAWANKYDIKVHVYPLDVRDKEAVRRVCAQIIEEVGVPDVLVNDAGLARGLEPYQDYAWENLDEMVDTNVKGLMYVTRCILPEMVKRNTGHIVNLGSTAGQFAYAGAAVYCATKAAVKMLSDGIRIDTIATDIKVTTIMPGIVETPFSQVRFRGDNDRAAKVYEGVEALTPEDIADIIEFVTTRPRRMQITDVTVMANQQATGFTIHRK